MWCDDFDTDLLKVVPGALEALGSLAGLPLLTYCGNLTDGGINHPACWNTYEGLAAFFWTAPERQLQEYYSTDDPVVSCTLAEAVRDEWVHSCGVVVDGRPVWAPPVRLMEKLMYDVRGWTVLDGDERERIRENVRASLRAAAARLAAPLPVEATDQRRQDTKERL